MTLIDKAEALLPCPFCGSTMQVAMRGAMLCLECYAAGPQDEDRKTAWNRRALPARGVGVDAVAVKNAVMGWVWAEDSDVSKRLGPKHTDALIARILAALEPAPTDAPNLADPVTVHANMLRGTIAKPTVEQIIHLYGREAFRPVIDAAVAKALEDACLTVSEHADWPEDEHGRTEQVGLFARVINAICSIAPAPTDAPHVNETPKSEHDAGNVLTAAQAQEVALPRSANRVDYNPDGSLDEIVTDAGVHLEHMGGRRWFLGASRSDGTEIRVWFDGKVTLIEDDATEGRT